MCARERACVCVLICPPTKSYLHKQIMRQLHEGSSVQPGGETPASARAVHAILRWVQAASVSASEQSRLRIQMRALEALHMVAFFQLFVFCLFPYDIFFPGENLDGVIKTVNGVIKTVVSLLKDTKKSFHKG